MPFLAIFIIAMIATGGALVLSILLGMIGGFLLGVAWIFLQMALGVAAMGVSKNRDGA